MLQRLKELDDRESSHQESLHTTGEIWSKAYKEQFEAAQAAETKASLDSKEARRAKKSLDRAERELAELQSEF